jgi:hypothetical protein
MEKCTAAADKLKPGLKLEMINAQPPLNNPAFVTNHFFVASNCVAR